MQRFFIAIILILSCSFASANEVEESSLLETIYHSWDLTLEISKDTRYFLGLSSHLYYSFFYPEEYAINPEVIQVADDGVARVVILIPGMPGNPACYLNFAYYLHERGVSNVFTVEYTQTDEDSVPVEPLRQKVQEVAAEAFNSGAARVELVLIGHSLGANIGSKYIWREHEEIEDVEITMMIALAGRLNYIRNKFWWFCEDIKQEIQATYQAIQQNPNKVPLYTIVGSYDEIMPSESVHILEDSEHEMDVPTGHGGVIFCEEAFDQIFQWLSLCSIPAAHGGANQFESNAVGSDIAEAHAEDADMDQACFCNG